MDDRYDKILELVYLTIKLLLKIQSESWKREGSDKVREMRGDIKKIINVMAETGLNKEKLEDLLLLLPKEFSERIVEGVSRRTRKGELWGVVESTESFIENYSENEDLLIPRIVLETMKAIQKFDEDREVVIIPIKVLRDIVYRILREAPYSTLLQNLKMEFVDDELKEYELEKIREIVSIYYDDVKRSINEGIDADFIIEEASMFLDAFNWGGSTVEKRILQLFYHYAEDSIKKAKVSKDVKSKVIYAGVAKMICRLVNLLMIKNRRVLDRLVAMKP
ncbi:MAG: hypothetical protein J7L50_02405 [Candidatus Odinarchaeota archaeon]|nr:hypothetical protein [Candidatus Odinarchaeota archaeon]